VDSIALTYSLLDPIMTLLRPVTAFVTAVTAGIIENFSGRSAAARRVAEPRGTCVADGQRDRTDCEPENHGPRQGFAERLRAGLHFAYDELMKDLALWLILGVCLAGAITVLVPEAVISRALGSGIISYVLMLAVSLPMYVCASMSTPIAAALIAKGMSPGTALVLLMAGPATNAATLMMVAGTLGIRTLAIYLGAIIACTLAAAFATDLLYGAAGISAKAMVGTASGELFPDWVQFAAAILLGLLIFRAIFRKWWPRAAAQVLDPAVDAHPEPSVDRACSCSTEQSGGT